jgi:hypothetical protein
LDRYSIVKDRRVDRLSTCTGSSARKGRSELAFEFGMFNTAENRLVELIGIEPTTSGLQNPRSPN